MISAGSERHGWSAMSFAIAVVFVIAIEPAVSPAGAAELRVTEAALTPRAGVCHAALMSPTAAVTPRHVTMTAAEAAPASVLSLK